MRIVIDTSVIVAASRSRSGASFSLISSIPSASFRPCLSVGLYAEWQQALSRPENRPAGTSAEVAAGFLRYLASECHLQEIYFLWRPVLRDADDDMVLELAVAARCGIIVTHNVRDFAGADRFGVEAILPGNFLRMVWGTK